MPDRFERSVIIIVTPFTRGINAAIELACFLLVLFFNRNSTYTPSTRGHSREKYWLAIEFPMRDRRMGDRIIVGRDIRTRMTDGG
ncbi:hypothetical protein J6590_022602 [Homalodisca vitripennis]|nr:hypothetical protein J6590_022602 [Homalodisca vitripennis]